LTEYSVFFLQELILGRKNCSFSGSDRIIRPVRPDNPPQAGNLGRIFEKSAPLTEPREPVPRQENREISVAAELRSAEIETGVVSSYELRIRHISTRWKGNFMYFPMVILPCSDSSHPNRDEQNKSTVPQQLPPSKTIWMENDLPTCLCSFMSSRSAATTNPGGQVRNPSSHGSSKKNLPPIILLET
jgi:hypothetical protein